MNVASKHLRMADAEALGAFCTSVFAAAGADAASSSALGKALLHGSVHGVDSHGVRLLPHYVTALRGGRLNNTPKPRFTRTRAATGLLDGDHAQGALPTYLAAREAVTLARETGTGAVGIFNSSHFGPAGAYAMEIVASGMIGLVFGNSDAFVRLHDGAARFHGTNPIAMAAPTGAANPWLFDMATSAITYNRVRLSAATGTALPQGVASDAHGRETIDAANADMLAPFGADFGYKGAGLAGMSSVLAAILTGGGLDHELLPMGGPDFSTPRGLGAFVIAIDPEAFVGAQAFIATMGLYLESLRGSPALAGAQVMAPGDREWVEAARRRQYGVPIDGETASAFCDLADRFGLEVPFTD